MSKAWFISEIINDRTEYWYFEGVNYATRFLTKMISWHKPFSSVTMFEMVMLYFNAVIWYFYLCTLKKNMQHIIMHSITFFKKLRNACKPEPLCRTAEYILYRCSHAVRMDKVKKNIYQLRLKQIFTISNTPQKRERKKELTTERDTWKAGGNLHQ